MTSGNLAGEPIVTDDAEARRKLARLADAWLVHDRADPGPVRRLGGAPRRRAGAAGAPLARLGAAADRAAGAGPARARRRRRPEEHLLRRRRAATRGCRRTSATWTTSPRCTRSPPRPRIWASSPASTPELVVADAHPGYRSAAWAAPHRPAASRTVQHHHAHIAAAMADNGHDGSPPVIGFAFDGTGYGTDGAVWGGEVLVADYDGFDRVGAPALRRRCPAATPACATRAGWRCRTCTRRTSTWDERLPCRRRVLARRNGTVLRAPARHRPALRADVEHGPAVRRDVLPRRRRATASRTRPRRRCASRNSPAPALDDLRRAVRVRDRRRRDSTPRR